MIFIATAIPPRLVINGSEYTKLQKVTQDNLNRGINNWILKASTKRSDFEIVDISFRALKDDIVLVVITYQSKLPCDISLQTEINKSMYFSYREE